MVFAPARQVKGKVNGYPVLPEFLLRQNGFIVLSVDGLIQSILRRAEAFLYGMFQDIASSKGMDNELVATESHRVAEKRTLKQAEAPGTLPEPG